ncbi:MAG TPA: addiction module protein [Terriglobia bacterium]|nr:addiction module protein [Terriglobia bacterium]
MKLMTTPIESVLSQALKLDARERAQLVQELLASLDGPTDPDASQAWEKEIQRRVAALEAGTEKLEPWDSTKSRIAKNILHR